MDPRRRNRTEAELEEIHAREPQVRELADRLRAAVPGIDVRPDGRGASVYKAYLTGRTGPFESFLWIYEPIDKSQVGWSSQGPLCELCRDVFTPLVLNPGNVNGSQVKKGTSVAAIVTAARTFAERAGATSRPT